MTITTQRLSDRVRIIHRHLLDGSILERLRLSFQQVNTTNNNICNIQPQSQHANIKSQGNIEFYVTAQDDERLRRSLKDAILEYDSISINLRPKLPCFAFEHVT